jgi:molybdate transport system ATP-binding protein
MPEPLIELHNVDVALNGTTVLRDITWSLRPGAHWMIHGANGSGKSTFLRLLLGEVWPAPYRGTRIYRLDGSTQMTAIEVRQYIALVSPEVQDHYLQQDWRMSALDVIHTGFAQTDFAYTRLTREQKRRAASLAEELGISGLLRRDMQMLSTGELRKVLLARAVVNAPKILLLDEVCDGLDARFRRELLAMIETIARHGTQLVYTTHRPDEALSVINHVAEFADGRLAKCFRAQAGRAVHDAPLRARNQKPNFIDKPRLGGDAVPCRNGTALIRIENADVFLDRKKVLRGINWKLHYGEHWVVLGANGAGKTTFLKLVASDLYPMFGARVTRFEFTADNTIWDLRARIGCVSPLLQTHYREQVTGEEVVASGFFSSVGLMNKPTATQLRKSRSLLREFNLEHLGKRSMLMMSFGELRKVLTLRSLVHDPQLLIFDEPFDGLDPNSKKEFGKTLEQIAARGTQLLIVTHHLDELPCCITHGLFLEGGRIVAADRWESLRQHPKVTALFGDTKVS